MSKLKLTKVQKYRIREAMNNTVGVLQEIKRKPLAGEALAQMKVLEEAVQDLEHFQLIADVNA